MLELADPFRSRCCHLLPKCGRPRVVDARNPGLGVAQLEQADGRLTLEGTRKRITVRNCRGDLRVETTSGEIVLEDLATERIEATSVDGDISLRGAIPDGSRNELFTHSGDLRLALTGSPDARFHVRAFRGRFETDLDPGESKDPHRAEFTTGTGSARIELQSFTGDVVVRRPGNE